MAFQRSAPLLGALLMVSVTTALGAQPTQTLRPGQTAGPKFLVPMFRSTADKQLGFQVADATRDRMMGDYTAATLVIVPKGDIETNLEASGYSKTEPLTPTDLRQLAPLLRADEYLDGVVTRGENGQLTLKSTMQLVRPNGMVQPLPEVSGAKPGDLAKAITAEIEKARKQIPGTRQCLELARAQKYDDAQAAAQKAITAYPRAVFARVCQLEMTVARKQGPDSIIKYAEEILGIYPENSRALILVTDAYGEKKAADKKFEDKYIEYMMKMLAADPQNTVLAQRVIDELLVSGKASVARPILEELLKQNPGDPGIMLLGWRLGAAMKDWKFAIPLGEEIAKADTARADTTFYKQLIGAYVADSQAQKAAEVAARATQKFPNNEGLWLTYAELTRKAGQLPQSLEANSKVLAINPKNTNAYLSRAQIFRETNQPDSVLATARALANAGGEKKVAGSLVVAVGNSMFGPYQRDSAKTIEQGRKVLAVFELADSLAPTDTVKFFKGVTKLYLAQTYLTKAAKDRTCDDVATADNLLIDVQTHIGVEKGGAAFPQNAGSVMQGAMQLQSSLPQYQKAFKCKPG
jgi:tetratricopeptide (TPR) repeat protein